MQALARCGVGGIAMLLGACAHAPPAATSMEAPAAPPAPEAAPVPEASPEPAPPPTPTPAKTESENPFTACLMPSEADAVAVLDETRRRIHETVCGASLWFDSLFGEGDVAAARDTHGHLEVVESWSQFEGNDTKVRFNAHVKLPAFQHRLSAFVGRDNDEDFTRDRTEGQALRTRTSDLDRVQDWFAGLSYRLREVYGVHTDAQVGVHGLAHTTVFGRIRMGATPYSDQVNALNLRLTPFINNQDGYGVTANADFDHLLSPSRLLRFGNVGTLTQRTQGMEWRSALILFQDLHELRSIAGELFVRGATTAPEPLGEYGARTIYRQPLFRARLFANLVLGYSWPRVDPALPRQGSLGLSVGLELPFGIGEDLAPHPP